MKTIELTDKAARWIEMQRDEEAAKVLRPLLLEAIVWTSRQLIDRPQDEEKILNVLEQLHDLDFIISESYRTNDE